jgi:predicted methyltransferase
MKTYEGHRIFNPAYLFYLESSGRDAWQKPEEVLAALRLAPGQAVADIGAGGGYFTEKLAARVGDTGHVYAVDVQDVLIRKLQQRVQTQQLTNVSVIHGSFDDPRLPPASCDLAFFSSVYKEIDDRVDYMKRVKATLKAGGRVAILEYRPETHAPGPPRTARLSEAQVIDELSAAGFQLEERFDFLPREYFLVFSVAHQRHRV